MKEIDEDRQEFSQNAETQQRFIHSEKKTTKPLQEFRRLWEMVQNVHDD